MTRFEEIQEVAYKSVMSDSTQNLMKDCLCEPTEKHIQYYVDTPRLYQTGYINGAKWADNNPSGENIRRFIKLFYEANKEIHLKYDGRASNMPSLEELEKEQISYIKEHWKEYKFRYDKDTRGGFEVKIEPPHMEGLFKDAKSGDKFLRRDGKVAIYVGQENDIWHKLECDGESYQVMGEHYVLGFNCDGKVRPDHIELDREIITKII